jgi:hypothetical protein
MTMPPTLREFFVDAVDHAFRNQFGVPGERLRWIREFMLQPDADHFQYALSKARDGMVVILLTDLRKVFLMQTDVDLEELLHHSYFRHDASEAYFFLKVNPLVNQVLAFTIAPEPLPVTDEKYGLIRKGEALSQTRTLEEMQALAILRMTGNRSVTFEFSEDGELGRALIERHHPPDSDFEALRREEPFQSLEWKIRDEALQVVVQNFRRNLDSNMDEKTGKRLPIVVRVND